MITHRDTKKDQVCSFDLSYYTADGSVLKRNSFQDYGNPFTFPDGEETRIP